MALAYALRLLEEDKNRQADQLRQLSGAVSPRVRGRDRRKHLLELRPRHRALALQLRLQRRQARLEPGLARAAAPGPGRAARRPRPADRAGGRQALQRRLGRPRRIHRGHARPQPAVGGALLPRPPASVPLTEPERVRALELMEMQRHAQLMYTSCGWFFDDISGIETVQVIAYAARVLQLAREVFGEAAAPLEPAFLAAWPRPAPTWPRPATAPESTRSRSATKQLGLEQVAAHYAISSMFSSFAEETDLFCFRVWRNSYDVHTSGRGRLALGRAKMSAPSPASRGASPSPSCTSATRTSPPPSKPTRRKTRPLRGLRRRGRRTRAARRLP
jgi:hypothetical protein